VTPESDARNRAWRTLLQGLGIDVAVALVAVLTPLLTNVEWTQAFWTGVAALAAKSVVQALVAFVARKVVPPPA
jgi:uncharacterized membrane protein YcjF (UPF0283 family)